MAAWHYEEMADWCQMFPWCSPSVFWELELADYYALKPVVEEMKRRATAAAGQSRRRP